MSDDENIIKIRKVERMTLYGDRPGFRFEYEFINGPYAGLVSTSTVVDRERPVTIREGEILDAMRDQAR